MCHKSSTQCGAASAISMVGPAGISSVPIVVRLHAIPSSFSLSRSSIISTRSFEIRTAGLVHMTLANNFLGLASQRRYQAGDLGPADTPIPFLHHHLSCLSPEETAPFRLPKESHNCLREFLVGLWGEYAHLTLA